MAVDPTPLVWAISLTYIERNSAGATAAWNALETLQGRSLNRTQATDQGMWFYENRFHIFHAPNSTTGEDKVVFIIRHR